MRKNGCNNPNQSFDGLIQMFCSHFFLLGEKKPRIILWKNSQMETEYLMFEKRPVEKVNTGKPVLCKKLLFYCCINCGGRNRPSSLHLSHVKSKKLRVVLFRTDRVDAGAAAVGVSLSKTGEINTLGWQKLLLRVFFDFFFFVEQQNRSISEEEPPQSHPFPGNRNTRGWSKVMKP